MSKLLSNPQREKVAKVGQSCIQNNGSRLMAKGKEVVHFGRRVKSFLKPSKE